MLTNFIALIFESNKLDWLGMLPQDAFISFMAVPFLIVKILFESLCCYSTVFRVYQFYSEKESSCNKAKNFRVASNFNEISRLFWKLFEKTEKCFEVNV